MTAVTLPVRAGAGAGLRGSCGNLVRGRQMWTAAAGCDDARMRADIEVRRVDFGYFVRPAEETDSGRARVEPVLGYLVIHPSGTLLFDTGMGRHPEVDAHYRPRAIALPDALETAGVALES